MEFKTIDADVRDRDLQLKEKGKVYGDLKRKATDNNLEIGEKVLVKNLIRDKLTINFNPTTHTVTGVAGGDVNIRNDNTEKEFRRNIVHLKKVNDSWTVVDKNINNDNLDHNNELN